MTELGLKPVKQSISNADMLRANGISKACISELPNNLRINLITSK